MEKQKEQAIPVNHYTQDHQQHSFHCAHIWYPTPYMSKNET